jgi:type VI secretion system (T6SS) FHA protein/FHA domain-containing protein
MSREYVIIVTQDADSQPIEHRVAHLPASIGRDAGNDVQVASQFVSGFHAKLEEIKGRVFVRDLGSRNGTQVSTADGAKTRVAAHALYDLAQCNSEFYLGSTVRVQVADAAQGAQPWRAGGAARRPVDSFMDAPRGAGRGVAGSLPDLEGPRGVWDAPADPRPDADFGGGPLSLPPLPGERGDRRGGTDPAPPPRGFDASGRGFDGGRSFEPPPPLRNFEPPSPVRGYEPPRPMRGFEPVGGGYGPPPGADSPHLATGNFQLSIDTLALQGLRELAGSLLPGQSLQTQGDVARLITRLHDAVDVLCRTIIPLRQSYLKFVSSMDLQKSAHFAQASAVLDMARDPSAVAATLLDFREGAPDASKALEGALGELATHQVAMLDGVMQGVRALLEELSPAAITEAAEQRRGNLRLGGRQKDAWDEYCERYERLSEESEAFSKIFGEEFAQAYRRYRRR